MILTRQQQEQAKSGVANRGSLSTFYPTPHTWKSDQATSLATVLGLGTCRGPLPHPAPLCGLAVP